MARLSGTQILASSNKEQSEKSTKASSIGASRHRTLKKRELVPERAFFEFREPLGMAALSGLIGKSAGGSLSRRERVPHIS